MPSKKTGMIILSVWGFVWCVLGSWTLPPPWRIASMLGGFLVLGALVSATALRSVPRGKLDGRIFGMAVAFEIAATGLAVPFLIISHQPTFILPAVAVIVGIHFVGMWLATDYKPYLGIAAAMCGAGVFAAFAPPPARMQIAGLGSAIILWVGAAQGISGRSVKL